MKVTVLDTTLRDGEQTSGVSFTENEKLNIARLLLEELKVDRIEIASARVSEGEFKAAKRILSWANGQGYGPQVEILGSVDDDISLNWIKDAGGQVLNLLCKGSLKHCTQQLRKNPNEHASDIRNVIRKAQELGIRVNIYLEDWSNGMRTSPEYVFELIEALKEEPIERFMLPDTLGILNHLETFDFCGQMVKRFPDKKFDLDRKSVV